MKESEYNIYVKAYTQSIYRFVCKLLGSRDAGKDIVQDAFLKLWEQGDKVSSLKVKAWLFTVAYRQCLVYLEKHKKNFSDDLLMDLPMDTSPEPDLRRIIDESLLLLSELQKSVLLLKDYEGYAYHEIAGILSISEDSVRVHLFRARQKIKKHIVDLKYVI